MEKLQSSTFARRECLLALYICVLALVASLCAACSAQSAEPKPSKISAAVAVAPVSSTILSLALPPLVGPQDMAISASQAIEVKPEVRVTRSSGGFGSVGAFGGEPTQIQPEAEVGNVYVVGPLEVSPKAKVHGSVTTGASVSIQPGAIVDGPIQEQQALVPNIVRRTVVFPSVNAGPVVVGSNVVRQLAPGAYRELRVEPGARVLLEAGTYYFESVDIGEQGTMELNESAGAIYVYVRSQFAMRGSVMEQGGQIGDCLFGYFGTSDAKIDAPFAGTFVAPDATVQLTADNGEAHRGAFFGKRVGLGPSVTVVHTPFPSWVIQEVKVSNRSPCPNESVLIEIVSQSLSGVANDVGLDMTIDGVQGSSRYLQFPSPGTRSIRVSVYEGKLAFGRTIDVDVQQCSRVEPRVVVNPSLFRPYAMEFQVTNADELTGPNRRFSWDFGDGSVEQTDVPFRSHSYEASLNAVDKLLTFVVTLRLTRDGQPDLVAKKTVAISNQYVLTKPSGYVRPPVTHDPALQRIGKHFRGPYRIKNLEPAPIRLVVRRLQRHFCDPDRNPELFPPESIDLTINAGEVLEQELQLEAAQFGSDTCGVSVHVGGTTIDGLAVRASAHFETPEPGFFTVPVRDTKVLDLLNDLARRGLVPDPNHIAGEDLERLFNEGRIPFLPRRDDINSGALQGAPSSIGQKCDPEATPPEAGVSCQATEEWTVAPPLIRNALKGDIVIVASCGIIGNLLRAVIPRQTYSHEGMMTRNYYAISHSTANDDRITDTLSKLRDTLDEGRLRYAWPGGLHESIDTAFNGLTLADPEGKVRIIRGFRAAATQCQGDLTTNPPKVIRLPVASPQANRDVLHNAADFARTAESHYRFYAFSHANIAFDPPANFSDHIWRDPSSGEPATVSTSFLWWALKSSGITLEGPTLEQKESEAGAVLATGEFGTVDGLYFYDETERREAAEQIYTSTKNKINDAIAQKAGVFADLLPSNADPIARQFTNCFASDNCGLGGVFNPAEGALDGTTTEPNYNFRNPGNGVAVSPDDFRFWDAPAIDPADASVVTGAYGDIEDVAYRSGDYRRVHRWAATAGTGSVDGHVILQDGSAVAEASVTVAGKSTGTDASGAFEVLAIPAGSYEIRAEKVVSGKTLVAAQKVDVVAGAKTSVTLTLGDEVAIPPPTLEVFSRRVKFSGSMFILDDEPGDDDFATLPVSGECEVSPLNRFVQVTLGGPNQFCVGGEVRVELTVSCRLSSDNETVDVTTEARLYEFTGCDTTELNGTAGIGPVSIGVCDPQGCTPTPVRLRVDNTAEGGDFSNISLDFTNEKGTKIELPNVKPENLRRVTFNGDLHIEDDDWPDPNESGSFLFGEECIVDPFDREDSFTFSQCVDEVRVEVAVSCRLGLDNTSVNVTTNAVLFEGTSCATTDRDGEQVRDFLVPACGVSCTPTPLDLTVSNTDEGGDSAVLHLQIQNVQRQ